MLERPNEDQRRAEYTMVSIQEMATRASRAGHSGTIGVEIPREGREIGKGQAAADHLRARIVSAAPDEKTARRAS